jgi:hypothetical protein
MNMKKLIESVDRIEEANEGWFSEYMGGYIPPFNTSSNRILDKLGNVVLKCENIYFARIVAIALNQWVERN